MAQKQNKDAKEAIKKQEQASIKAKKAKAKKKEAMDKKGKNGKAAKPSLWLRIKNYFKAVKSEMKRVVWPTRKELVNASLIVVGALIFFGVFIAIIDNIVLIPLDALASLGK